jgi:hypothetical protein
MSVFNKKIFIFVIIGIQQLTFWLKLPSYNSISGFAYKDASNWELCAKSLANFGVFPVNISDWCLRRPINIEILSLFLKFIYSTAILYALLGIIFSFALLWSYSNFSKILSKLQSGILLLMIAILWLIFANNMVLSESIGIILGTLSLGLLSKIYLRIQIIDVLLLAILLIFIQIIRPGNLASPFLLMFLAPYMYQTIKLRLCLYGIFLTLPILYPMYIKWFSKIFLYDNYLTGGNSWASAYGLVNNNITWQESYRLVPPDVGDTELLVNEYLKNQTISDFIDNPLALLSSLGRNTINMFSGVFPFFSPVTATFHGITGGFLLISYITLFSYLFRNLYRMPMNFGLKLFSASFILTSILFYSASWKSEAARSLSPTLPILVFIVLLLLRSIKYGNFDKTSGINERKKYFLAILIIPFVLITGLLSINHSHANKSEISSSEKFCGNEDFAFVENTVTLIKISEIRSSSLFSWSKLIDDLPNGYLIQGIAVIGRQPFAVSGYFEEKKGIRNYHLMNSCFRVETKDEISAVLSNLNLSYLVIVI